MDQVRHVPVAVHRNAQGARTPRKALSCPTMCWPKLRRRAERADPRRCCSPASRRARRSGPQRVADLVRAERTSAVIVLGLPRHWIELLSATRRWLGGSAHPNEELAAPHLIDIEVAH